jgi:hypothetical protein
MSKREAPVAINSIAQQASPIGMGQSEFLRIQFMAASSRVKITFPSIFESYATGLVELIRRKSKTAPKTGKRICEMFHKLVSRSKRAAARGDCGKR